jgi:quercetin dioxygenase-like cupin family protein
LACFPAADHGEPIKHQPEALPSFRYSNLNSGQPDIFGLHLIWAMKNKGSSGKDPKNIRESVIERKKLLTVPLGDWHATAADVRSLHFSPGQKTGLHVHPCPTITYIVRGSAIVQLESELGQELHAAQAFYEPAGIKVLRFDNASSRVSLHFIAVYLVKGDEPLIEMLK